MNPMPTKPSVSHYEPLAKALLIAAALSGMLLISSVYEVAYSGWSTAIPLFLSAVLLGAFCGLMAGPFLRQWHQEAAQLQHTTANLALHQRALPWLTGLIPVGPQAAQDRVQVVCGVLEALAACPPGASAQSLREQGHKALDWLEAAAGMAREVVDVTTEALQ